MMGAAHRLTIDRLTVRGGGATARRRAVARVEAIDLPPPGPPAEVLIVRRLADPLPGALSALPHLRRKAPGPADWAHSLGARLATLRRQAARPARGPAPPEAEAVLFADEAEMLACLAEALAKGRGAELWWCRALSTRIGNSAGPAAALHAAGALLPAVLALLVERGSAARVLARLSAADVRPLLPLLGLSPDWAAAPPAPHAVGPQPDRPALPAAAALPPPALASALAALPRPAAALLAAGWLRRRRPDAAPAEIACRTAALLAAQAAPQPARQAPVAAKAGLPRRLRNGAGAAAGPATAGSAGAPAPAPDAPRPPAGRSAPSSRTAGRRAPPEPAAEGSGGGAAMPAPGGRPRRNGEPPAEAAATPAAADAAWGADVATRLGGLFFLVNLYDGAIPARALALAAALDMARRPDDGPWAALERLARALLSDQSMPTDPAWRLLATLDGRAADVPLDFDAADAAAAAAARAWIAAAAWGPRGPDAGESVAQLLRAEARLHATSVHLDVVLPADAVRLPARRAGLDLDPGWSPRFGRIVAFHYRGQAGGAP